MTNQQATLGAWTLEGRIQAIQERGREALQEVDDGE